MELRFVHGPSGLFFTISLFLLLLGGGAQASPTLEPLAAALAGFPLQVAKSTWEGRPALSVVSHHAGESGKDVWSVQVFRLVDGEMMLAGGWELPEGTRFAEPLRLPGGANGWLILTGRQWRLAIPGESPEGAGLVSRPLCPCNTIYTHGGAPHHGKSHFVHDLDGDGVDEITLPFSSYLEAYRIAPAYFAPEPIWRAYWNAGKRPLPQAKEGGGFRLPIFSFRPSGGSGKTDLLIHGGDALSVASLPELAEGASFSMDGRKKALLIRGEAFQGWPDSLRAAMRTLKGNPHQGAREFLDTLSRKISPEEKTTWAAYLGTVLGVAKDSLPVVTPYRAEFPALGAFDPEEDRRMILAVADMDGDAVVDVLHATLRDFGSIFGQENQLTWYRGRLMGERLSFAPPGTSFHTDAGSFAEIVSPHTNGVPPQALLLATTEVSFSSVLQALASQQVNLRIRIFSWEDGELAKNPRSEGDLTYRKLKEKGRRAMFLLVDLDGDGIRDYLANPKPNSLHAFLSSGKTPTLKSPSLVQKGIDLPAKPGQVLIADLDEDGREELVLWYQEKYHGDKARTLQVIRYRD